MRLSRFLRTIKDYIYWLKCRLWYKYNVVTIKTLPPTWHDRDYVMLHACFQILVDFVEKEKPWEFNDLKLEAYAGHGQEERLKTWNEIRFLYNWWKNLDFDDDHDYDDHTEMLKRLVSVRKALWT